MKRNAADGLFTKPSKKSFATPYQLLQIMKKKISPFGLLMMWLVLTACAGSLPSVTALAKSQQAEQDSQTSVDSYIIRSFWRTTHPATPPCTPEQGP